MRYVTECCKLEFWGLNHSPIGFDKITCRNCGKVYKHKRKPDDEDLRPPSSYDTPTPDFGIGSGLGTDYSSPSIDPTPSTGDWGGGGGDFSGGGASGEW